MSAGQFFTVTPHSAPNTVVVQGTVGRYSDMRTVWLEETPGLYVVLDDNSQPARDQFGHRTEVYADGDVWSARIWAAGRGRFVSANRDEALAIVTKKLAD